MGSTAISTKTVEECVNEALDKFRTNRNEVDIGVIDEPKQGFLGLLGAKDAVIRASLKDDTKEKGTDDFVKNILDSDSNSVETEQKGDIKVTEDKKIVEEVKGTRSTEDNDEIVETVEIEEAVEIKETEDVKDSEESRQESEQEAEFEESNAIEESDVTIDRSDEPFITNKNFLRQTIEDMGIDCDIESRTEGNMVRFNILCSQESDIGIVIGKRRETLDSLQYIVNLVTDRNADTYIRVISDCNQYRSERKRSLQKLVRGLANEATRTGRDIKPELVSPYERRIIHIYLQNDESANTFS